jgi:hypothetical protein
MTSIRGSVTGFAEDDKYLGSVAGFAQDDRYLRLGDRLCSG